MKDEAHEAKIDAAMREYMACPVEERAEKWKAVCDLIGQRTPQAVKRMEESRGLR